MRTSLKVLVGLSGLVMVSCASIPKGATAVAPFDAGKYLGTWYEIARFDFRFERNLDNTTANYSLKADGTIKVVNRGFNYVKQSWSEAVGKAKFRDSPQSARLMVSFFGPFYAAYNVIKLDENYHYALVAGQNLSYLWILSREKTIPDEIKTSYVAEAKRLGYDVAKLIWVEQKR